MDSQAARLRDITFVMLVPLFLSSNIVIGRLVVTEVSPWTLAFLRWFGAFLILLPFVVPGLRSSISRLIAEGWMIVLMAFLGMWICGGLVYVALHHTTATNATLIYTSSNVMILVLEWLFRGRRLTVRQIVGTALAFAGVAVVAVSSSEAALTLNPGDLLFFVTSFSWAVYSVLLKRPALAALPALPLFAATMFAGSALLLPMMLWEAWTAPAFPADGSAWLAVVALWLIPSVGAFSGYQYGIRRFGPGTMATLFYLSTPYGLLLAILFLGESFTLHHALGLALILPGVILATFRLDRATPAKAQI